MKKLFTAIAIASAIALAPATVSLYPHAAYAEAKKKVDAKQAPKTKGAGGESRREYCDRRIRELGGRGVGGMGGKGGGLGKRCMAGENI